LTTWCHDVNEAQADYSYTPVYVKQEKWEEIKQDLKSFAEVAKIFKIAEN